MHLHRVFLLLPPANVQLDVLAAGGTDKVDWQLAAARGVCSDSCMRVGTHVSPPRLLTLFLKRSGQRHVQNSSVEMPRQHF